MQLELISEKTQYWWQWTGRELATERRARRTLPNVTHRIVHYVCEVFKARDEGEARTKAEFCFPNAKERGLIRLSAVRNPKP